MTKLPRNIKGRKLAAKLAQYGFAIIHQTGSHIICRTERQGRHTEVIPDHTPLKTGTLGSILSRIASHLGISRDELIRQLKL